MKRRQSIGSAIGLIFLIEFLLWGGLGMSWYYSKLELPSLTLERMHWWPVLFASIPLVLLMAWHLGWRQRTIRSLLKGSDDTIIDGG